MYRGNCTSTTVIEEEEKGYFGRNGSCEIPPILSHSEFACLHQSIINEDYEVNMHEDILDGILSLPSAGNNIQLKNLETHMSYPFDDFAAGHPTSSYNCTNSVHDKEKIGTPKSLKKSVLEVTKRVNKSSKEVLKAYGIVHPSSSKDGHNRVATPRGLRDTRIRLSFETAIKFFLVQDRLGFDQPTKALEWLLEKCRPAIDELPTISLSSSGNSFSSSKGAEQHTSRQMIANLGLADQSSTVQEEPINNVWAVEERAHICSRLNQSLNYGQCEMQIYYKRPYNSEKVIQKYTV